MHKVLEWIKTHPYETGALALVGAVAVYLLFRSSSATPTSQSGSSTDSAAADYYNAQLQAQQLAANNAQASAQLTAQTNAQNLQASVENTTTAAQLSAVQDQDATAVQSAQIAANANVLQTQMEADVASTNITSQQQEEDAQTAAQVSIAEGAYNVQNTAANDSLAAISDQIGGQIQQAQIAGQVADTTTAAQVSENQDDLASVLGLATAQDQMNESEAQDQLTGQEYNDQTAVALNTNQYAYLDDELNDATDVNLTQLQDVTTLDTQQQANQVSLASQTLSKLVKGGSSLAYNTAVDNVLAELEGESGVAVSGNQAQASINNSDNALNASTTSTVAGLVQGLFA
jgi:hypothetical protein